MDIKLIIAHLSSASVLIPLVLAVIQWKRMPAGIAPLRWLLVVCVVCDLVSFVMARMLSMNNKIVGDIYMFIQFTLLLYIFSIQFERKNALKTAYTALVASYVISLLFLKSYSVSTSAFDAIASMVLIIVSILFFYKLLNELKIVNIHRLPILWISFAALFYYSGNLFLFLASNYLQMNTDSFGVMWILHNILNFTKNILFAIALWQSFQIIKDSHG